MPRRPRDKKIMRPQEEFDTKSGHYNIRKLIKFKNEAQKDAFELTKNNRITFLCGPAGTAKTFLSVHSALDELYKGTIEKIVFTRPMIEASGEKMGFLPGTLSEKIAPYMTPLFDFVEGILTESEIKQHIAQKTIEVYPLAFMRGKTFKNAFVVCDESQNMNYDQIKMLLSRIGQESRMVLTGDSTQSDLKKGTCCFDHIALGLSSLSFVGYFKFEKEHIVRDPIIVEILDKLEEIKNGWE